MLRTAQAKIERQNLKNVSLTAALADDFQFQKTFDLDAPFDKIFFSYSISMIPAWEAAIANAIENLKPGGSIFIVDFYDQNDLPAWFRRLLKNWLKQFHVRFQSGLLPHLADLEKQNSGALDVSSIARRYAFIARFQKNIQRFSF